jgi:hypothetical protein
MKAYYNGKLLGVMYKCVYVKLMKESRLAVRQEILFDIFIRNNQGDDVSKESIEYVKKYRKIMYKIADKCQEPEYTDSRRNPPIPRVSEVMTFDELQWLIKLYEGMVKLDPAAMMEKITEKVMMLDEKYLRNKDEFNLYRAWDWDNRIAFKPITMAGVRRETIDLIKEIEVKVLTKQFKESNDDPPVEVWNWVLVVLWWRISFDYKRYKLDEEEGRNKSTIGSEKRTSQYSFEK